MQCCIVCPIFFSLRSRNDCAVKCWKLRSFRITAGSLSMKHWSVLCLGGFCIGFYLQQRRGEILSFTRKPRTEPMELDGTQSETLLAFSSSPQARDSHLGGCKSSCWRQCLMPGSSSSSCARQCLLFSSLCGEAPAHHSCPQTAARSWGGFSKPLQVCDSVIRQTRVSVCFFCNTRFNTSKCINSSVVEPTPFGVDESFVIDISALRYFGFVDSSFQESERLWGFMVNINLIMCQWGLAQPQHISFFLGFTLSGDIYSAHAW